MHHKRLEDLMAKWSGVGVKVYWHLWFRLLRCFFAHDALLLHFAFTSPRCINEYQRIVCGTQYAWRGDGTCNTLVSHPEGDNTPCRFGMHWKLGMMRSAN